MAQYQTHTLHLQYINFPKNFSLSGKQHFWQILVYYGNKWFPCSFYNEYSARTGDFHFVFKRVLQQLSSLSTFAVSARWICFTIYEQKVISVLCATTSLVFFKKIPLHSVSKVKIFFSGNKKNASAGNRTRVNCLEGSYANHYTTDASSL